MTKQPPTLDPQLVELWERGALSPITLELSNKSLATAMRHRLYRLRIKMQEQTHPSSGLANGASITITPRIENEICVGYNLTVYPLRLELDAALEAAGITTGNPPPLE